MSVSVMRIFMSVPVGEAMVEVTPKPHNGCSKFDVRFGNDALRFVQAPATRQQQSQQGTRIRIALALVQHERCLFDGVVVAARAEFLRAPDFLQHARRIAIEQRQHRRRIGAIRLVGGIAREP